MADEQKHDFNIKSYLPVLATAYGEGADQDYDAKVKIVSTILNRAESGKAEFGADTGKISDVLQKGYYAYSQQSPKFKEAMDQKFPDKASEDSYKEYVAILSGMLKNKVARDESLFFLTPSEVKSIKAKGKKVMDMDLLEETGRSKAHIFYKYKTKVPGKGKISKKE